jgi:4-hydroxybenzoate polyprenyltransferase
MPARVRPALSIEAPAVPAVVRVLRIHQWSKNLLVFLPIMAAHRVWDRAALLRVALAFVSFSLVASSVYVLNDALDVESDRRHAYKRERPFASGALGIRAAVALVPALLAAGAGVALQLPRAFLAALAAYLVATGAYSLWLKRVAVLDVLLLAGLYVVRIYAGAFAAGVPVSEWLASFSLFFFLSLAVLKRATELGKSDGPLPGRGYRTEDRAPIGAMGIASGYLSVLVLALYLNHPEVGRLYSRPQWLWGLCVLVLFWISRAWLLAWRGEIHDDPVVFAFRDPLSWAVAAAGAGLIVLGS